MNASRSLAWTQGGQIASMILTMIGSMVLARLLTPTQTGAFAFATVLYALVQSTLQLGMGNYILREPDMSRERLSAVVTLTTLQGAATSLIIVILAPFAGLFGRFPNVTSLTLLIALVPLLNANEAAAAALWSRERRFLRYAGLQVAKVLAQITVSIATAWLLSWGSFALAAGIVANALAAFLICSFDLYARRRLSLQLPAEEWQRLKSFSSGAMLLSLVSAASTRLPELLIGRVFTVTSLGHYSRSFGTVDLLMKSFSWPLARVFVPRTLKQISDGARTRSDGIMDLFEVFTFFLWPALVGLMVLAEPLTLLLYGPQWELAGRLLPLICLATILTIARSGAMEGLLAADRLRLNSGIEIVRLGLALLIFIITAPFGLFAVLWGQVLSNGLAVIIYGATLHRLGMLALGRYVTLASRHALLALVAVGPALGVMIAQSWPRTLPLPLLAGAIIAGILCWVAVLAVMHHPFLRSALGLIHRR